MYRLANLPVYAVVTHLKAMFPFMANDTAFMNSVVLGTSANRVKPKNFSSIPDPSRTTSTTSTRISEEKISKAKCQFV